MPLGNPGTDFQDTRHNLGRLMLQRWMADRDLAPAPTRRFPSGSLYPLKAGLQVLVPSGYMNLSGEACAQAAAAGIYPRQLVLLHDDKDLPLGTGRFRLNGSDGGHNGLRSVFDLLGTQDIARLRLGIGPFERPLADFVLDHWTDPEWERLDALDAPFAQFLELLGRTEDLGALGNLVNPAEFWGEPPRTSP
ncbi:MAG: aminoacyl-tRNA hydrolase [Holophagaceae bacterium]|uniref:Peptidyl-tRNA hydrolase n=1 Tax=Candidatus Geothrix skivensis TaxID=2954439 RepID=A0A9D7XGH3_9BACT|nr:aminoacyl-tRNA hydrolase [Candidatus Geothrix skivensis]